MTLSEALENSRPSDKGWRSAFAIRGWTVYYADVPPDGPPHYSRDCTAAANGTGYTQATPEEVAGLEWKPLRRVP